MTQDKLSDERQHALSAASQAFCNRGIEIACPWDSDLDDLERERFDAMVAAIDAHNSIALRSATPMPGVKALEWDEVTQARSDEDPHREVIGWECPTGFDGFYIVEITGGGASLTTTNYDCTYYGSPDEAKAAAQADFEARVLSALTTTPAREISEAELERVKGERDAFSESYTAVYELVTMLTDKLDAAEASLGVAVKALEPFVAYVPEFDPEIPDAKRSHGWTFQVGDFRAARSALASIQVKGE